MLSSKKLTFSLTSLIVLIAFGLVCFAPSVFADGYDKDKVETFTLYDLTVKIGSAESMIDVSAVDHPDIDDIQIATGRDRASRAFDAQETLAITLLVDFSHVVNLAEPGARIDLEDIDETTTNEPKPSGGDFGADDLYVAAYDKEERSLGVLNLAEAVSATTSISQFRDTGGPGRQFLVRIDEEHLRNAYLQRGGAADPGHEIYSLVFFIPRGKGAGGGPASDVGVSADNTVTRGIRKYDRAHAITHFGPDAHQHLNKKSNEFQVDLVDDDQGDPQYAMLTGVSTAQDVARNTDTTDTDDGAGGPTDAGSGTPGVVSIMRIVDRAGFIESGDFDVRIILTEEPMGGLTADKIMVSNGSVKSVVKGATYKGGHPMRDAIPLYIPEGDPAEDNPAIALPEVDKMDSELGPEMVMYYHTSNADGSTAALGFEAAGIMMVEAPDGGTAANGTVANFSEATGRDNRYHSYIAAITPSAGLPDAMVTVSVATFDDNVLPVPNRYVPLTAEQRIATTLTGAAMYVRDARVKNESLSVRVSTAKDTTSDAAVKKAAGITAYETRRDDDADDSDGEGKGGVYDLNPSLKELGGKLVIPANGYLVLVRGTADNSGVVNVSAKFKEKLTDAQKLYNVVYEFALPQPGPDLDNFFRNGGTIRLIHGDLPAATGSGTDESKAAPEKDDKPDTAHADYAGYDGATTKAYAKGDVVISEIMWGGSVSQYIELHNTTAAAIPIDHLEWAIAVKTAVPTGFTELDAVGNNPSTGYWEVPGADFEVAAAIGNVITEQTPAASMSRVSDATSATGLTKDGTAEASWATSLRRDIVRSTGNANIIGNRIGTPGAANAYVEPEMVDDDDEMMDEPMAPAAEAGDIMISEIMVASNDGRLPQWIEIANDSTAAVSLSGWSLEIDNDAADTDVVGASIEIDLGDVEIGAHQVALVVSKEGRNSGVDTAGAARVAGDANAGDLDADRIINVQNDVSPDNARYRLISEMGFMLSLIPPQKGAVRTPGDVAGNLGGGWELPMSEGGRSSLIRSDKDADAGTDAADWMLASDTMLNGAYRATYYGSDEDVGTPGFDAGGALPVELSSFNAARDRVTGAVVITWETQSELNNAGFFIKRSQQQKSKFVVVNPTMIAGAGTTAEKQSYTYTDATADPNVIYFYQIEDVSLDGNRQTLTRAHRLKGHIGAAGKATTTWGELKSSRE